jgi:hypothetical protein
MDIGPNDVWKAAALMLGKHGHHALRVTAERAQEALDKDDAAGHDTWVLIGEAIQELARPADEDDRIN